MKQSRFTEKQIIILHNHTAPFMSAREIADSDKFHSLFFQVTLHIVPMSLNPP